MERKQKGETEIRERRKRGKKSCMIVLILSLRGRRKQTDKETIKKRWIVIFSSTCRLLGNGEREREKKKEEHIWFAGLQASEQKKENDDPAAAPSTSSSDSL